MVDPNTHIGRAARDRNSPRVVAVLTTRNEERFVAGCLENLFRQGVQVYICDNQSTDRTLEIAQRYRGAGLIGIESIPHNGWYCWEQLLRRKEELFQSLEADWFMHGTVIPNTARLLALARQNGIECLFARIACHTKDGRDRSLSQKMPGWNNLLLPKNDVPSQLVAELQPAGDEIVVTKTTDSALTGTNLRLILHNLGIRNVICCGIFTDQCVSSTVRSLADESYAVIVLEDCCAAATDELHRKELEIINMPVFFLGG